MLSRDIEGRIDRRIFSDVEWALRSSRHVPHPTLSQLRQIKKEVLASPSVIRAMKQVAEQKSIPEEVMQKKAKEILQRMQTKMQFPWVRTLAWFFRKVWRSIYQQLDVNEQSMLQLAEVIKKGPVVLIPSHRSYIDFIILSYVLFAYNLPIPVIAAGEDFLNLSFVSNVLRFAGAFFLRRTFRGDILYNAIFTEYVQRLVLLGCPLEFFIEGTRSRSGKLLQPKMGLMGIVTDVFYEKKLDELTFVPISTHIISLPSECLPSCSHSDIFVDINYENVIEDEAYTKEWLGDPKKKESLENLIKASRILSQNYGRISLKFGDPISLKEYTQEYTDLIRSTRNDKFDPFKHLEDRKDVNIALSHQLIYDINAQTVWAPLALIGSLLLTYRTGILRQHLSDKVEWLVNEILRRKSGYEEWMVEHSPAQMTNLALERFAGAIEDRKDMISCPDKNGVLLLAFYRNRLIHLFVRDSFVLTAFGSLVDGDVGDAESRSAGVAVEDIFSTAEFLVHVVGKEFVYKVHPDEEEGFDQVLEDLILTKVLERMPNDPSKVRLCSSEQARSAFNFYAGLLWPFIEAYWVACLTLYALRPSASQMQPLIQRMQWMAESLIAEGRSGFYETCSVETLKNAIHAFHRMKVMRFDNFGEVVALSKEFSESNATKLKQLLLRLGSLRRRAKDKGVTEIGVPKSLLEDFPIRAKL
jgi:glycerol-3-phosphate O-acyltransferase